LCHELICWLASSFGDQHFSIDLMASDGQVFIIIIIIIIIGGKTAPAFCAF